MNYKHPTTKATTALSAKSFVMYAAGALVSGAAGTETGRALPANVITTGVETALSIGKIGFNAAGNTTTADFIVDDLYANSSADLAILSPSTASAVVGTTFNYTISTSATSGVRSFSIDPSTPLPANLSLNTVTGEITGLPTTVGTYLITLNATDGTTSATTTLTLEVTAVPTIYTWNNTGTNWSSSTSWTNGAAPATDALIDTAQFGNTGSFATDVNVGSGNTIKGIVFNTNAYAYTWTGTSIKVLSSGAITNNSSVAQTFGNKLINSGNATWSSVASGSSMVFNGGIDLSDSSATNTLTFAGAGNATVNGTIANGGGSTGGRVTFTSTGTNLLSGGNTYGGLTTMNAAGGTLTLSGNNSGAAGGVTLTAGTLNINNDNALGTGPISFATGTRINNTSGAAVVNAGNQPWTWTDLLTFGSSTNTATNNLNLGTGIVTASSTRTITLAGTGTKLTMGPVNITSTSSGRTITANNTNGTGNTLEMGGLTLSAHATAAQVVDLLGSANFDITGPIQNGSGFAHGVNVGATGTNTFSGANTYTGTTKVSGNTLILSGTSASSGYILAGSTNNVTPNVVLKVNALNALNSSATLLGSSSTATAGTLEFAIAGDYTLNQYTGLNMNFSNSSGSASTLTFTNATNTLGTTSGKTFANRSANLTITFNGQVDITGTENSTNTISTLGPVVISNRVFNSNTNFTRGLLKLETNSLTMYGVNSYNGATTVSGGTLVIPAVGSLVNCGATIVKGSGTVSATSASLNLGGAAGVVQVSTNGFVRGDTNGSATTLGTINSLQVQTAGTVEVALGTIWSTDGTIDFAAGSKVSVTGASPVLGQGPYTLMTASGTITGTVPTLSPAIPGWNLDFSGANLILEETPPNPFEILNGTRTFSEIISGGIPLDKRGDGTAIITGSNTFSGGTVLGAGILEVQNSNGLGTGAVTLTSGTLRSTVDLNLGRLVGATTSVGNAAYQAVYGINSRLQYSGLTTTIDGPVTLDVGDGTTMTMGNLIGNSSSSSLVTKIGAGTVKLMGGNTKPTDAAALAANGSGSTVLGGWKIQEGTVWFEPSANNGAGNGPIILAGGTAKFSKLQNSNGTYTGFTVPSDLTVESSGLIQFDPNIVTLLGQNNLEFKNLSIGANTLEVATATTSTVVGQGLPSVNFKSATLTGSATLENPVNLDLNLQAVSGGSGFTKTGLGTLYLSDQPNRAAAFATLTSGGVESIVVEYAGSGYLVAPTVTVEQVNGGSGAQATATIDSDGRVTSIAVTAAGSGYNSSPRVVIAAPPTVATANSYTGVTIVEQGKLNLNGTYATSVTVKSGAALQLDWLAPAEAKCSIDGISTTSSSPNAAYSYVKNLYLTKSVGGYVPSTTFEFDLPAPAKVDGTGTATGTATYVLAAARASATVDSNGFISALSIVSGRGGSGYSITPIVTIPAPTQATVVAKTTGSITFESGAKLSVNNPPIGTGASCTLLTADGGILGAELPGLLNLPGYTLTKSGNSLILTDNRAGPTISANPTATSINYGVTLASSILDGGSATGVNGAVVGGTFAWKVPSTLLSVGTSSQIVIFTPNDLTAYRPAEFTVSVTVSKASLTPEFSGITSPTYDGTAKSLSATTTPATIVNLTYDGSDTAPTSAGIYEVVATVSDANYEGSATTSLVIGKAAQTITFDSLPAVTNGAAPLNLAATASSGLEVSYASSDTSVATVSGSTVTILKVGSTVITASQAGSGNYNAAVAVPQTLTVNKADQAITFASLSAKTYGDAPFNLAATTTSGLAVAYVSSNTSVATVSGSTVTIVGAGSTVITASQAGGDNYNAAVAVPQTLTVNNAAQTITFASLSAKTYGDAPFNLAATTTSGLAVAYVSSNTSVATVSGSTVTIVGAGSTVITASQAGGANYNAAVAVPQTLTVGKVDQMITFGSLSAKTYGDAPFNLAATTTSGLEVSYASSDTSVATVSGSLVTILKAGSTIITASQAGGDNYNAAVAVPQTLTVNPATPAGTTYSGWLNGNGASDAAFLDYVFGAATPGALPASLKPTVAVTGGNLVLTYYVRQGTLGLTVAAQTSANLATGAAGWGTSGVTDVPVGEPTTAVNGVRVQQRTASVSVSGGRKFLRIQAVQAAP